MSFRKKQILGFGLIMLFITVMLVGIIVMINNMKSNMLEIVEDRYGKVSQATEIQQLFSQSDRELLYLMNEENKQSREESIKRLENNRVTIQKDITTLSSILNRAQARDLLTQIQIQYANYIETETQIVQKTEGNINEKAFSSLFKEHQQKREMLTENLGKFKKVQEDLMNQALKDSNDTYNQILTVVILGILCCLLLIMGASMWVIKSTSKTLKNISDVMGNIDYTDLSTLPRVEVGIKDEIGQIGLAFNEMASSLERYNEKEQRFNEQISDQNWIQTGIADVTTMYQNIVDVELLADKFMAKLTPLIGASMGAFYLRKGEENNPHFLKVASFAGRADDVGRRSFLFGEGIIGQCAIEKKMRVIEEIPTDYTFIASGLGEVKPTSILIAPVLYEGNVVAVIELASIRPYTDLQQRLLVQLLDTLGITVNNVLGRMEIERLLAESQMMTEELQAQSEELQTQSEELQAQSEELQSQSEELRMINEQLEERTRDAEQKSMDLQMAKNDLEEKAEQLQLSSKYKSEFLANMSHELRTPLNSILILSEMLSDTAAEGSLEDQKEFATVIHSSGKDLLNLINDILDLSKVEAGKLDITFSETNLSELPSYIDQQFRHVSQKKGLSFVINKDKNVPDILYSDEQRIQQILKNLLSNSFKFTEEGSVSISIRKVEEKVAHRWVDTKGADFWIEIKVVDTGIGIAKDKQQLIFEAFQQAEGATARKYGGTGLGLSICREFIKLLGGWIMVESQEGQGSVFTLYIPSLPNGLAAIHEVEQAPLEVAATIEAPLIQAVEIEEEKNPVPSDASSSIYQGKTVLICDDDNRNIYALKTALEAEGMNIIAAQNGIECLELMEKNLDIDIVLMDIMMPGMDGYETMQRIRSIPFFNELPIIALTAKAMKGDRQKCLEAGASDYISKPLKLDQLFSVMSVWLTKSSK